MLPELYHVTDDTKTIPFDSLPESYNVKPTHSSGDLIVIKPNDHPNEAAIREQSRVWLASDHGPIHDQY